MKFIEKFLLNGTLYWEFWLVMLYSGSCQEARKEVAVVIVAVVVFNVN